MADRLPDNGRQLLRQIGRTTLSPCGTLYRFSQAFGSHRSSGVFTHSGGTFAGAVLIGRSLRVANLVGGQDDANLCGNHRLLTIVVNVVQGVFRDFCALYRPHGCNDCLTLCLGRRVRFSKLSDHQIRSHTTNDA